VNVKVSVFELQKMPMSKINRPFELKQYTFNTAACTNHISILYIQHYTTLFYDYCNVSINNKVCMKVMQDVRDTLDKPSQKDKPKIEKALGEHCKKDTLSARERKICYYVDPIKRDVAQPFSLGMPVDRLCKRINKSNPEICGVKFPVKTENLEKKDLTKLRVKQLKSILMDRGVECKGCVEKEEFIKMVQDTEHLAGQDEF